MRRHAEVEVATLAGPVPLRVAADDTVAAVTQARSALRFLTLLNSNTLRRAAYYSILKGRRTAGMQRLSVALGRLTWPADELLLVRHSQSFHLRHAKAPFGDQNSPIPEAALTCTTV